MGFTTYNGVTVTDAMIDRIAEEYETDAWSPDEFGPIMTGRPHLSADTPIEPSGPCALAGCKRHMPPDARCAG